MIGLRIEELPAEQILRLDQYYNEVRERQRSGEAKFHLSLSRVINTLDWLLPIALVEMGNCAGWASSGLKAGGITDWRSYYPKRIFVKLLEETMKNHPEENWNVISYQRVAHAQHVCGIGEEIRGAG